ncbi:hypothetical protein ACNQR7_03515 [Mycolicibacterium senegalense]|uniref:hypothetical protein n=1 Tax=Mycolicibacterium TaxID=1866885 RepID=UPI003204F75C
MTQQHLCGLDGCAKWKPTARCSSHPTGVAVRAIVRVVFGFPHPPSLVKISTSG